MNWGEKKLTYYTSRLLKSHHEYHNIKLVYYYLLKFYKFVSRSE